MKMLQGASRVAHRDGLKRKTGHQLYAGYHVSWVVHCYQHKLQAQAEQEVVRVVHRD